MGAKQILENACGTTKERARGGSTALVLRLNETNEGIALESAVLGDSGFSIYRWNVET